MTNVQLLECEVKKLDRNRLAVFRDWFRRYDSEAWDRQIEKDIHAGKLDKFSKRAVAAHKAGKTKEL